MAKWDRLRKSERNRLLVEYHEKHPEMSWREIGELFNISGQRAWELYDNERKTRATRQSIPAMRQEKPRRGERANRAEKTN